MKKIGLFLLAAVAAITLSSCNDGEDGDYASAISLGTVHTVGGIATDFYITLDNGEKAYVGDKSRIGSFLPVDEQRVVFTYNLLKTPAENYDYNIALYAVAKVSMGDTATVDTSEELEALGTAKVSPYQWVPTTRRYFNLSLVYYGSDAAKHTFTLVRDNSPEADPKRTETGFYNLELRHDDGGDSSGQTVNEWMTFDLRPFEADLQGMKGIIVKFETHQNGTQYFRFDLGK